MPVGDIGEFRALVPENGFRAGFNAVRVFGVVRVAGKPVLEELKQVTETVDGG